MQEAVGYYIAHPSFAFLHVLAPSRGRDEDFGRETEKGDIVSYLLQFPCQGMLVSLLWELGCRLSKAVGREHRTIRSVVRFGWDK